MAEVVTVQNLDPDALLPDVSLDDFVRYGNIIRKVVRVVRAAESMAPGGKTRLDILKFEEGDKGFEWDLGTLARIR